MHIILKIENHVIQENLNAKKQESPTEVSHATLRLRKTSHVTKAVHNNILYPLHVRVMKTHILDANQTSKPFCTKRQGEKMSSKRIQVITLEESLFNQIHTNHADKKNQYKK